MADANLTEISHLFLSSIRERDGAPRPQRTPPPSNVSVDVTAEEFAEMMSGAAVAPAETIPPVTAVLASHFAGDQSHRVRQYAKHLAAEETRIGMIEADACE